MNQVSCCYVFHFRCLGNPNGICDICDIVGKDDERSVTSGRQSQFPFNICVGLLVQVCDNVGQILQRILNRRCTTCVLLLSLLSR